MERRGATRVVTSDESDLSDGSDFGWFTGESAGWRCIPGPIVWWMMPVYSAKLGVVRRVMVSDWATTRRQAAEGMA